MKKIITVLLAIVTVAYFGTCGFLYVVQDSLIYYPQPSTFSSPQFTMILPVSDAEIAITTRPHVGPKAIIYFGGNGEDVSNDLLTYDKTFPDYAIYLMHYRGYGGSTGAPSEEAIYSDAVALFKAVMKDHADISIIGRSLGTGVATRLASKLPVAHLVLITPFDSLLEIASNQFPYLPVSLLLRDKYDSGKYVPEITSPTTILMADNDQLIPRQSTEKLFSRFHKGVASLIVIRGAGHGSISNDVGYLPALQSAL